MFENFRKNVSQRDEDRVDIRRRVITFGGLASAAAVGFGFKIDEVNQENPDKDKQQSVKVVRDDLVGEELSGEAEAMETGSGHFFAEQAMYAVGYVSELQLMEQPERLTALLNEHFDIGAIPHPDLRREIMDNILGLVLVESRYDETRVSEVGAFGVMQLMPDTWKTLALPDEDPTNVIDQIKVAARLFVQSYQHISQVCRDEIDIITNNHFGRDESSMLKNFFGPVLIGSYNSGMGNLEKIIKNFVKKYPTTHEIVDMFDGVDIPTGYDVYLGMTKAAMFEEWRPSYKIHGSEYVSKVYGAKKAITIVS
jgi:Transglycosylase SLT domain